MTGETRGAMFEFRHRRVPLMSFSSPGFVSFHFFSFIFLLKPLFRINYLFFSYHPLPSYLRLRTASYTGPPASCNSLCHKL